MSFQHALLQMLESKNHWQISDSSGVLDLTFAFERMTRRVANVESAPPAPLYTAASSSAAVPGKRFSSALTIVFIFEPSDPLIMIASPARIAATACASRFAALSA